MKKTLLLLTFVVLFSSLAAAMLAPSYYEKEKNSAQEHFIGVVHSVRPITAVGGCMVDMVADVEVSEVFKTSMGIAPDDRVRLLYHTRGPALCSGPAWHSHLERGDKIEVHANSFAEPGFLAQLSEEERLYMREADVKIAGSGIDILEKGVQPQELDILEKGVQPQESGWIWFLLLVVLVLAGLVRGRPAEKSELFRKDASGGKASKPFIVWMLILVVTLLTAILVLFNGGTYNYYGNDKLLMTSLLFFALSAALFLGMRRGDRKLLLWTGLLEFIILLLPLLSFDMSQDYLFFSIIPLFVIVPFFVVMFAVLWISLPIGLFYLQDKAEDRKRLWRSLLMLALVAGIFWVVFRVSGFNRLGWAAQRYVLDLGRFALVWSLVFLVPLAIWKYVERRLSAPSKDNPPGKSR